MLFLFSYWRRAMKVNSLFTRANWFAAVAALALLPASSADAVLIQTGLSSATQSNFSGNVSSIDLLNGITGTHTGTFGGGGGAILTNGAYGADTTLAHTAWTQPGAQSTYDLGVGPNSTGWDITTIRSFAAWNGASYGSQSYDVFVETYLGGGFTLLASAAQSVTGAGSTQITLADSIVGTPIATNIRYLRFNFTASAATDGRTTYRELDVFGSASAAVVPEPTSLFLIGCAALGLMRVRRCN
jgi:hypothetical protein